MIPLGRFCTTNGCPSGPEIPCAIRRTEKSLPPPTLLVTMRIGLFGYYAADAKPVAITMTVDTTQAMRAASIDSLAFLMAQAGVYNETMSWAREVETRADVTDRAD